MPKKQKRFKPKRRTLPQLSELKRESPLVAFKASFTPEEQMSKNRFMLSVFGCLLSATVIIFGVASVAATWFLKLASEITYAKYALPALILIWGIVMLAVSFFSYSGEGKLASLLLLTFGMLAIACIVVWLFWAFFIYADLILRLCIAVS